MPFTLVDTH